MLVADALLAAGAVTALSLAASVKTSPIIASGCDRSLARRHSSSTATATNTSVGEAASSR
ncbi:MAG: hypothetical protein U1E76_24375 [Planctomycetota bacterium]